MDKNLLNCLRSVIVKFPAEQWLDTNTLRNLLNSQKGANELINEINLLVKSSEYSVPQMLLRAGKADKESISLLTQQLDMGESVDTDAKYWLVACWAHCLGFCDFDDVYEVVVANDPPSESSLPNDLVRYSIGRYGQLTRESSDKNATVNPGKRKQKGLIVTGAKSESKNRSGSNSVYFGRYKSLISLFLFLVAAAMIAIHVKNAFVFSIPMTIVAIWIFVIPVCPRCSSIKIEITEEEILNTRYTHARKDGGADRRYKNNPLVQSMLVTRGCSDCNNSWKVKETRQS